MDTPELANLEPYLIDIYGHMIEVDRTFQQGLKDRCSNVFGDNVNQEMRKILIRWLAKVATRFRTKSETFHMSVQIIDLMLIHQSSFFNKANFQLLGVAALFVSCKYHEIYTAEAEKYVALCEGIYTVQQLF